MNNGGKVICPLCNDAVDKLLYRFHIDSERSVIDKIKEHNPGWAQEDGVCSRCVDYYQVQILREQRFIPEIGPQFPVKSADDYIILPTPLRLDAHPRYTGKGVTICIIDSGFYPHPDLVKTRNRIKAMIDITGSGCTGAGHDGAWHGTMTSVVCAGDGYLGKGLYKGIASDADLVLLKVQDEAGKITTDNIAKALQWVLDNHKRYQIRVLNLSLSGDENCSFTESKVDLLAEELFKNDITVIAAVGNDENGTIRPPANALHVIAVGGLDDGNQLGNSMIKAYHSSYGATVDHLMKPELVAHAIWLAAPILPGTKEYREAAVLHDILNLSDTELTGCIFDYISEIEIDSAGVTGRNAGEIRELIVQRMQKCKFISPHYMHVDGTSFASPIVASVVAQLLEANPQLTAAAIREVLFSTSTRIDDIIPERQGYGLIRPRKAILKTLKRELIMKPHTSPHINKRKKSIEFYIHNDCAEQICLAGSFNHWAQDVLLMEPARNGLWKIEIPLLPNGTYQYKFLIDGKCWMEDVDNPYREPDGFNGFNSLLFIQN